MLPVDGTDWRDALPLTSIPGLAAMLKPPQERRDQAAPSPPDMSADLQAYTEPPPPPHLPPPAMQEGGQGVGEEGEVSREVGVERCCIVV